MTMTREQVESLLSRAPEGPWRADGEPWNRIVWSGAENRVCFMAHSNGLNDDRDVAASDLAAAAPDLARALLAALDDLDAVKAERDKWHDLAAANGRAALDELAQVVAAEARAEAAEAANAALTARNEALVGALEFYADETGWNQPPVQTREGLLSVEYESQASKVRKDRGKIARAAIRANAGEG